jgi:hypothetical protein
LRPQIRVLGYSLAVTCPVGRLLVMTATLSWVCLPPDCARAAMETGAATRYRPRYPYRHGFDIDTLFWGAVIFLALFVSCLLAWKAIERLRNRKKPSAPSRANTSAVARAVADAGTDLPPLERRHMKDLDIPKDIAGLADKACVDDYGGDDMAVTGGFFAAMAGMNERETEEFLLLYGPKKVRKAIKERRKARERAQTKSAGQTS